MPPLVAVVLVALLACTGCGGAASDGTTPPGVGVTTGPADVSFYRPPLPPRGARAGDLVWATPVAAPDDGSAYAIMYWSTAGTGGLVPVSGVLLVPDDRPPGTPVVAWAHGTSGLGDNCAPSLASFGGAPNGADPILERIYETGAIVVATDYRGLGTPGEHPFLVNEIAGRDVLDSLRAASRFVGSSSPSAVIGQSQGGSAALFAAQLQPAYAPDVDLRGAVGISVPYELGALADDLDGGPYLGYVAMAVDGYLDAYPQLRGAGAKLTEAGKTVLSRISTQCTDGILGSLAGRAGQEFGLPVVLADPAFRAELARNDVGGAAPRAPMMVVQGLDDDLVRADRTRNLARRYCSEGASVLLREYPNAGHVDVRAPASADMTDFLDSRLGGQPTPSSCPLPG